MSCSDSEILKRVSGAWACAADGRRRRLNEAEEEEERISDIRLKTNIKAFPAHVSASEILSTIEIFSYNTVGEGDSKDTKNSKRVWGFSAQELASKTENIVSEGGDDKFTESWTHSSKSLEGFFIQAIKSNLEISYGKMDFY